MSNNALATRDDNAALMEKVLSGGDLSKLSPAERLEYYRRVCESVGLNPLTRPFDYLQLSGKLTLYAKRDAADQLRKLNGISIGAPQITYADDLIIVTVTASDKTGRSDGDVGVLAIGNLKGEARANAILKCVTKAKRRVTMSICGLGWLDETEVETIPNARPIQVDDAGVVIESAKALPAPVQHATPLGTTPDAAKATLLEDIAGLLTDDPDAADSLRGTDLTAKTVGWLELCKARLQGRAADRAAQPVTKVDKSAERAETAQDAPEPPCGPDPELDDVEWTPATSATPAPASNGLSKQADTISKAIGKASDADTVDWALDDARQAFEVGHITDRERDTLLKQGELKKASLAKPEPAVLGQRRR